jgi:iron complex outermembrane recepter protein
LPDPISYDAESGYTRDLLSDALVLKYDDEKFVFKAVSSYQYMLDKQMIDQDFSPVSQFFATQNQKQHMFSQELSLQSKNTERYSWLFGTHFFVQQFYNDNIIDYFANQLQTDKAYDQKLDGIAFYHQSTLDDVFIPNLSVSAGVRAGTESNKMAYIFYNKLADNRKLMVDTVYNGISSFQVLPKFTLSYAFGASNAYASVTRGFKTGGYNTTFERPEDLSFEPEYSWNYELGIKSTLFNNNLFVEASAFYIDWTNQQISQSVPSGRGFMLKNAGETVSKGLELSVSTATIQGFSFAGAYGLTHATFIKNELSTTVNYNGNFVPFVPRHTLALQANKSINLQWQWLNRIVFSAIYKGNGDIYWNEKNAAKQDYYGTLDGRISFVRGNFSFDIWGGNLTNTSYNAFYFDVPQLGKSFVQQGKPMQGGVKLNLKI